MKKIFLLCITSSIIVCCKPIQINKTDLIELDELEFEKYISIYDSSEYRKSQQMFDSLVKTAKDALFKHVEKYKDTDNIRTDSTYRDVSKLTNQSLYQSVINSNKEKRSFSFKFQDSLIVYYDNMVKNGYLVIDMSRSIFYILSKVDSASRISSDIPYQYDFEFGMDIKENKNDKKNILGIDCFKVTVSVKCGNDENVGEAQENFTEYELYVSDKLQYRFHPIIKFKTVLDKYYPLEIIKRSRYVKGSEYVYKLSKLKTKESVKGYKLP